MIGIRRRDLVDEVELTERERCLEELARQLPNEVLVGIDRAWREELADDAAEARVLGRVGLEHRPARLELVRLELLDRDVAELGGEGADVAMDRDEVVVPGHHPEAVVWRRLGVPEDGLVGAEPVEVLERDALDERVGAREVDSRRVELPYRHARIPRGRSGTRGAPIP